VPAHTVFLSSQRQQDAAQHTTSVGDSEDLVNYKPLSRICSAVELFIILGGEITMLLDEVHTKPSTALKLFHFLCSQAVSLPLDFTSFF
jgi:hypothetical protein